MNVAARRGEPGSGGAVPPGDRYLAAVEEYRFQARHNWSRTRDLLVFNTAILAAGTAVTTAPGRLAVLVFAAGIAAAGLSGLAIRTQHDYYRAARDRLRRVEDMLGVPMEQRTDTTATLGDRRRLVSVNQVVYLLLGVAAVADAAGIVVVAFR